MTLFELNILTLNDADQLKILREEAVVARDNYWLIVFMVRDDVK